MKAIDREVKENLFLVEIEVFGRKFQKKNGKVSSWTTFRRKNFSSIFCILQGIESQFVVLRQVIHFF